MNDTPHLPLVVELLLPPVVLATLLGVLGMALWRYVLAPIVRPGDAQRPARRRRLLMLGLYALLFAGALGWLESRVGPLRWVQVDEEQDYLMGLACAKAKGCPVFGNAMNAAAVKLPPLNRYLIAVGDVVRPLPLTPFVMVLVLLAAGVAWMAALGDELYGPPFGFLAAILFGSHTLVLDFLTAASNGAFAPCFAVGAIWGTVRWVRGGGGLPLLVAVACLVAVAQLHGSYLPYWGAFGLVAITARPRTSLRAVAASAAVVLLLYSPWIVYQVAVRGSNLRGATMAWMFSGESPLGARLPREAEVLAGWLYPGEHAARLHIWLVAAGAIALAIGIGTRPGARSAGRALLPFLLLPMLPPLLAGGAWARRYGIPIVPAAALVTVAALRAIWPAGLLRPSLERPLRVVLAGAMVVLLGLGVLWTPPSRGRYAQGPAGGRELDLARQLAAVKLLRGHGFRAADLETHVHGTPWCHWHGAPALLGYELLPLGGPAPTEDAVIVEACERAPSSFTRWQHPLPPPPDEPGRQGRQARPDDRWTLLGYAPALGPVEVELSSGGQTRWSGRGTFPFFGQMIQYLDAGNWRALLDPSLGYPTGYGNLVALWNLRPERRVTLRAVLAPGSDDRLVVLFHDKGATSRVRIDGAVREPTSRVVIESDEPRVGWRFLVPAKERVAPLGIEVELDVPGLFAPRKIDLYEEPSSPCLPSDGR